MSYNFVKSKYASPWVGIVLDKKHRTGINDLYTILIVEDRLGNTPRKRIIATLDSAWTQEINKFNISHINKDWFINYKPKDK